jgi:choline dehydrogenase-like flavoprotein
LCFRGCPFGGYFSSNSTTIPAAQNTGNLTIRPFSVVHSVIYDNQNQRAKGVRVIDTNTKEAMEFFARIVFVNAGTLNTALILLNSTSPRFPDGLGNDSTELGHNLMDHNYNGRVSGEHPGYQDSYFKGRRPTGVYIPKFRNWGSDKQTSYKRGFAYAAFGSRGTGSTAGTGNELTTSLTELGPWKMSLVGMGECLPNHENKVTLSKDKKDDWGIPLLNIDASFTENEHNMTKDIMASGSEMLEKAGFTNIKTTDMKSAMGLAIHEMGTARMGRDPKTSVLNRYNQVWGVKNVFVTDGACMTSGACQNPSLTYMALTARAANFAVEELTKGNL